MTATLFRGPLSQLLKTALESVGKPVGYAAAPQTKHGWGGNQPNAPGSEFIPYLILQPLAANVSSGPLSEPQSEWQMPYQIQAFGISGKHTEWMADQARDALDALRGLTEQLGPDQFRIQQVYTVALGGITRLDVYDPPYFAQADTVSVWLSKEMT
jgi:hypothetical protein